MFQLGIGDIKRPGLIRVRRSGEVSGEIYATSLLSSQFRTFCFAAPIRLLESQVIPGLQVRHTIYTPAPAIQSGFLWLAPADISSM